MEFIFPYITLAITIAIIWFMPKQLSRKEIYITWGFMAALTVYTDLSFGAVLDLYDFGNSPKIDFYDLPLQATLPASFAIIFLNFMPQRKIHFVIYLILTVLFSLIYEWISLLTEYLVYKGWKMWYSIPFYVIGMLFLRWHLFFLRKRA